MSRNRRSKHPVAVLARLSPPAFAVAVFALVLGGATLTTEALHSQVTALQREATRERQALVADGFARLIHSTVLPQDPAAAISLWPDYLRGRPDIARVEIRRITAEGGEYLLVSLDPAPSSVPRVPARPASPPQINEIPGRWKLLLAGEHFAGPAPATSAYPGSPLAEAPLMDAAGELTGCVRVVFAASSRDVAMEDLQRAHAHALVASSLLGVLLAGVAAYAHTHTVRNIRRGRAHEKAAREQRDLAETANHAKSELLAVAAHDLRNPLNGILGQASSLLQAKRAAARAGDTAAAEDAELLEAIHGSAEHMVEVLRGILVSEGIGHSGQAPVFVPVDLSAVVGKVLALNRPGAARKTLPLHEEIPPGITAHGDATDLREACDNYVSNAVKYSPPGRAITVTLAIDPTTAERVFTVRDQGPGLTAEDHAKLFGAFQKLTAQPTAGESSTGLGLSIVKTIVQQHGGRVGCESAPGAGAAFWLRLPPPPKENTRPDA